MTMSETTVDWPGRSGSTYRYWTLQSIEASSIKDEPGNYVFAKQIANGNFVPLYFGQAASLKARLPNHDVWPLAVRRGATHVMAHTTPAGEKARLDEERDLIERWNPELNVQHRTTG